MLDGDPGALAAVSVVIISAVVAAVASIMSSRRIKERSMSYVAINAGRGGYRPSSDSAGSSKIHPIAVFWFFVLELISLVFFAGAFTFMQGVLWLALGLSVAAFLFSFIVLFCLKVADQWDRVVVLRLGKMKSVQPPGMFWLVPFVDT